MLTGHQADLVWACAWLVVMTNYGALHKPFDSLQILGELYGWLLPLHTFSFTLEIAVQSGHGKTGCAWLATSPTNLLFHARDCSARTVMHDWLVARCTFLAGSMTCMLVRIRDCSAKG